jgi:hypothetical protein
MSFFELDDLFTYQDVNDIKKFWAATEDPAIVDSGLGEIYLNIASTPYRLKRFNGSQWEVFGEMTAQEILTALKTVDGSSSGLDADKLDGQEGFYYQNAANLNSGTIPSARLSAADLLAKIITVDGSASGLDADTLDTVHASQFIRSDASADVTGHTEWQDTYQVRLGSDADLRLQFNGSNSYIDNCTNNLFIRQLSHGNNIFMQAENASGTMKTLLTLDPDKNLVEGRIARSTLVELWQDNNTSVTASPYFLTGNNSFVYLTGNTINFGFAFGQTPKILLGSRYIFGVNQVLVLSVTTTSFKAMGTYSSELTNADWVAIGTRP